MSDPVLSQLVAVESDLAQQSETLTMQLSQIQEQRQGLRTVISMFQGANGEELESLTAASTSALPDEADLFEKEVEVEVEAKSAAVEKAEVEEEVEKEEVEEAEPEVEKATAKKSVSKKAPSKKVGTKKARVKPATAEPVAESATKSVAKSVAKSATKSATKKPAADTESIKKKKDGRAATWQKYVQADYREAALPEAVSSVLRSQPSDIFAIADVMSSIFREDMPRPSYLKARNRISNILSAGARDGTWYRGRNGRYSQSESVMKAK